ncbi:hypothetical protein OV090_22075 [Nannocystis sp. RBIL2]|uniref:hypothetical protein n=1 Tax=Nannocystis sp. RBIL2 TaxID=2996788 RepID=UPI00226F32BB|nr:hypothetical protein [Nannocystis sp. RBIL2]MCY1067451.1 hypothetical protein [Nannocystis sp. RBIL2]
MRRALLLAITLTGCGPGILDPILTTGVDPSDPGDATASETGGPPQTTSGASISSTSSAPPTPDPTTLTSGVTDDCTFVCTPTDDGVFISPPDPPAQCDVWTQDCPVGEKCSAAGPPPFSTGSIACAAIAPGPAQLGEPCQVLVEGHLGPDTCDLGLYCHDVDPLSQKGTCIPLCTGAADNPACPIGQMCMNAALPLCLAACDPLLDACPAGHTCLWFAHEFGCWPDGDQPKHGLFEVCEYVDQCEDGLICLANESAAECDKDGAACCIPFCDLNAPACPGVGQACKTFYPDPPPPAGLEHLGVCFLP